MDPVGGAIGQVIRFYRGRRDITQEQLARRAGIAPTSVVRLENGEIERPRISTLTKIADALEMDPEELTSFVARHPAEQPEPVEAGGPGRLTAVFERGEQGWWVASCPEIPEAITQGRTMDEARENLKDAIRMELDLRREEAEEDLEGREVVREQIAL